MPHNIELIVAAAAPVVVLVLLRVNAPLVFLSLCLGQVLVEYVGSEATTLLNLFSKHAGAMSTSTLQLALLLLPAGLTTFFMLFSVKGHFKFLLNVLPASAVGLLALILAVPLLPPGLSHGLETQALWHQLEKLQALIVGTGGALSLALLWLQRRHASHDKDKEKKKH